MATASQHEHPPQPAPQHFMNTSGATNPVWIHDDPYSNRPPFSHLEQDLETDIVVIGSGISGVSCAYELVTRGHNVVMLEAREVVGGETGRTSGHLASALDDGYTNIAQKHGDQGAIIAAESHNWAIDHVGEVTKKLNLDCDYRQLRGIQFSQYDRNKQPKEHASEISELKEEVTKCKSIGMDVEFHEGYAVKGWDGLPDQRDAAIFQHQATFHPTKYVGGILAWLKEQPNFKCFTHTRVMDVAEKGIDIGPIHVGSKTVQVKTDRGHTVTCGDCIMATCIPMHKLSVVAEMEYTRTYCIAIRIPKGTVEDCLLYDLAEAYKYVRLTPCDDKDDYMVVGGCDHPVGREEPTGRFQELETWTRERFTKAGSVDYAWSGQVFEPMDYMAFIGRDPGTKHTWIITGDSGNGLTHGVLAAPIIADEIEGKAHPWSKLYAPTRTTSIIKTAKETLGHAAEINAQYKRFLQSDIHDIEDLPNGEGGVLNPTTKAPLAVYKDDEGGVHKFSAMCPHLKGVICWNRTEKSWDCPVHGSRFSKDGLLLIGPAKGNLQPADADAKGLQEQMVQS
ncbi:hypothetical protein LTR56_011583 [Elasticomyces elasticus]|nr:hypothetical protein LTR56_011583 [Elasticomyces elasticus]KAK3656988.1 hypothetical protein LTR22_009489 [Elasticomyces elasticus]KAK4916211.1 hypothetical protein LTR49_015716 [Elasticomyces elasticus]KAK5764252.1 hypothetical protein LTS12_005703 [Elasticomyces elasticus]